MPIHDWSRVDAGIFHHFHLHWIATITDVHNQRLLPGEYYALTEQQEGGFEPDVLALKLGGGAEPDDPEPAPASQAGGGLLVAEPRVRVTAETDLEFYHVSREDEAAGIREPEARPLSETTLTRVLDEMAARGA